jgi:hypothetical protein
MKLTLRPLITGAATMAMASALALAAPLMAQADNLVGGIGSSKTLTAAVKVKSVNLATRQAVLVDSAGNEMPVKVGPHVRNLDKVKPGDTVKATYNLTVEYTVTRKGAATPADSAHALALRAPKGGQPAGAIFTRTVTTDVVLGVDTANNTMKLSDVNGGQVDTVHVANPLAQIELHKVKVGDKLTAKITQSLLVAVDHI